MGGQERQVCSHRRRPPPPPAVSVWLRDGRGHAHSFQRPHSCCSRPASPSQSPASCSSPSSLPLSSSSPCLMEPLHPPSGPLSLIDLRCVWCRWGGFTAPSLQVGVEALPVKTGLFWGGASGAWRAFSAPTIPVRVDWPARAWRRLQDVSLLLHSG